jgi:hypothetical protein
MVAVYSERVLRASEIPATQKAKIGGAQLDTWAKAGDPT